jgi:trimethylamine--corrinoid protein Co-methyltransferase
MTITKRNPHAPLFRVLSEDGVQAINNTVIRVLSEVGVEFPHERAQDVFRKAGAKVDGKRIRIPAELLIDALQAAPSSFTFYNRDKTPAMNLEPFEVHFGTYGTAPYWYNPKTGERELSTLETIAVTARVCDALPNVEWSMPMGVPSDVEAPVADRHQFFQAVTNNTRTLYSSTYTAEGMADVVEMAAVVAGGLDELREKPFFTTGINPGSPLRYDHEVTGKLMVMADAGVPMLFNPMPMAGGTTPTTMASTVVIALSEGLAGITLAQLINPGVPVVTGGVLTTMDMRTTVCAYGAPELSLMMAGITEMCRFYEVPSYGTAGCSNSKVLDPQAAIEATNSLLTSAFAGSNMIHDIGLIDTGMTVSLEAFVMSDEIIKMVRRIAGGLEVSEETLAYEVIAEAGPGGHFLDRPHTLRHFREHHYSPLINRQNYDEWLTFGALTMNDQMTDKVQDILNNHFPEPLSEDVVRELEYIIDRATTRMRETV